MDSSRSRSSQGASKTSSTTATTTTRTSIRTPLQPAKVSNLRAMFDKSGNAEDNGKPAGTTAAAPAAAPAPAPAPTPAAATVAVRPRTETKSASMPASARESGVRVVRLSSVSSDDSAPAVPRRRSKDTDSAGSSSTTQGIPGSRSERSIDEIVAKYKRDKGDSSKLNAANTTSDSSTAAKFTVSKFEAKTSSSLDSTNLKSLPGSGSPILTRRGLTTVDSKEKAVGVLKLNLGRMTSPAESVTSSLEDSPRSPRSGKGSPTPRSLDIVTPKGFVPTSPKLGQSDRTRSSPSASPRLPRNGSPGRIEIPVTHVSSSDRLDLHSSSESDLLKRLQATDLMERRGSGGVTRATASETKTNPDGSRTTVSRVTMQSQGPLGSRTKTVEVTQTERKWSLKSTQDKVDEPSVKKETTTTEVPWADRSKILQKVGEPEKAEKGKSTADQPQLGWLEKKNALNREACKMEVKEGKKKQGGYQIRIVRDVPVEKQTKDSDKKETKSTSASPEKKSVETKPRLERKTPPSRPSSAPSTGRNAAAMGKSLSVDAVDGGTSGTVAVRLRKTNAQQSTAPDKRVLSRKISTERFQQLMFDFERGVPPERQDRRPSDESADHIQLKKRVLDIDPDKTHKTSQSERESTSFKRKEESIFASGLKVSDFVKQLNNMECNKVQPKNAGRAWKAGISKLNRSASAHDADPGSNEYSEVSEKEDCSGTDTDHDGIYEFVADFRESETAPEEVAEPASKVPSRRYAVYRKQKGIKKPSFKIKPSKSGNLSRKQKSLQKSSSVPELDSCTDTVRVTVSESEEEGETTEDWETDDSGTSYESIEGEENLYESFPEEGKADKKKKKKAKGEEVQEGPTLGEKLKKKGTNLSAQATSVLNRIGNRLGKIRQKGVDSGVSAGTDSDQEAGESLYEGEPDPSPASLSRSSSQRSSGRRPHPAIAETTSLRMSEDEGTSSPTPPPLPPHLPPPLPPRTTRVVNQPPAEKQPPLPPRNPAAGEGERDVNLDTVVPLSPRSSMVSQSTGDLRKKGGTLAKDSYLYGQELKPASSLGDVTGGGEGDGEADGQSVQSLPDGYMDFDPSSPKTTKPDGDKTDKKERTSTVTVEETSTLSSKSSSIYIYPDDVDAWPRIPAPVSEDSGLYLDLDDDQIYGKLGQQFTTKFDSEPLYQWYTKDKTVRASRRMQLSTSDLSDEETESSHSQGEEAPKVKDALYEDLEHLRTPGTRDEDTESKSSDESPSRKSTLIVDTIGRGGSLHRALWCEMPEVKDSGILDTVPAQERKIQEAMFEIITSEASYFKSLNILINVFLMAPEFSADMSDRCVVTKRERQILFSNIGAVRDCSEKLLADLEERWQKNPYMEDICDILHHHAAENFEAYVRYTSNQSFQDRLLETLKKRTDYMEAVRRLERNPECQMLPMASFLLLPMQRITRLPLLVDAICHRLEPGTPRHRSATQALYVLNKVVRRCNDEAKKMQQTEQICMLANQLEFKVKEFPLISASRFIVKQGELTRINTDMGSRLPFGKAFQKPSKHSIYLFLFNDMLLVSKKKGNQFIVTDYGLRNTLHVEAIDNVEKCRYLPQGVPSGCRNLFLLVILENHEKKQHEIIFSCNSPSDRTRWLNAMSPVQNNDEAGKIYEDWDCPQVQCITKYSATELDELSLEESDVINVLKKLPDGWFYGERIRDGEKGWFPSNYVEEIMNSHVRARNLRLRYRLLVASQDYAQAYNTKS